MSPLVRAVRGAIVGGYAPLNAPSTWFMGSIPPPPSPYAGVNLPRAWRDSRRDTDYLQGGGSTVLTVNGAGTNYQAHLNTAAAGSTKYTIVIPDGVTCRDSYQLPGKANTNRIVTMGEAMFTGAFGVAVGSRCGPTRGSWGSILETATQNNLLYTQANTPSASGYHFWGLRMRWATSPAQPRNYGLIAWGTDGAGGGPSSLANCPDDLGIDQCWMHGHLTDETGDEFCSRGILWNGRPGGSGVHVVDSYLEAFKSFQSAGQDTQAFGALTGGGPIKLVNNYLESTGENIISGGAAPAGWPVNNDGSQGQPEDWEIRRNHIRKPLAWTSLSPNYLIKNLMEWKYGSYVFCEGNVLEGSWAQGQDGVGVFFQGLGFFAPADGPARCAHITFRHNLMHNVLGVATLSHSALADAMSPTSGYQAFYDNFCDGLGLASLPQIGYVFGFHVFTDGETAPWFPIIEHNTVVLAPGASLNNGHLIAIGTSSFSGLDRWSNGIVRNNIFPPGPTSAIVQTTAPLATRYEQRAYNVMVGVVAGKNARGRVDYPYNGNLVPTDLYRTDTAAWPLDGNGRPTSSELQGTATDGKDIGCDITALQLATGGVAEA